MKNYEIKNASRPDKAVKAIVLDFEDRTDLKAIAFYALELKRKGHEERYAELTRKILKQLISEET